MSVHCFYVGVSGSRVAIIHEALDPSTQRYVSAVIGPTDTGASGPNYAAERAVRSIAAMELASGAVRIVFLRHQTAVQILRRDVSLLLAARGVELRLASEYACAGPRVDEAKLIAQETVS